MGGGNFPRWKNGVMSDSNGSLLRPLSLGSLLQPLSLGPLFLHPCFLLAAKENDSNLQHCSTARYAHSAACCSCSSLCRQSASSKQHRLFNYRGSCWAPSLVWQSVALASSAFATVRRAIAWSSGPQYHRRWRSRFVCRRGSSLDHGRLRQVPGQPLATPWETSRQ